MTSHARNIIKGRILPRLNDKTGLLHECIKNKRFWVAGGALTQNGTDIDVFCPEPWIVLFDKLTAVSKTRNAITVKLDNNLIQFCNYSAPCLKTLLESFDFAHCQIGCEVISHNNGWDIVDVVWTEDYTLSRVLDSSWFIDTNYPLSSLARNGKYYKKGVFTRSTYIRNMVDFMGIKTF